MTDDLTRKLLAEFLGTFALVFLAVGTAVVAGAVDFGLVAVALAFGLVLAFGAYAFGPVSGCHVNPAVTIAMIVNKRIDAAVGGLYVVVQFLGAIAGAFVLWLSVEYFDVVDQTGALGSNGYGPGTGVNLAGALVIETLLTMFFVLAVLLLTDKASSAVMAGVGIGARSGRLPPDRHRAHRNVGQPRAFVRAGALCRWDGARAGVGLPPGPCGRWACWLPSSTRSPGQLSRRRAGGRLAGTGAELGRQG